MPKRLLHYRRNELTNRHEARCKHCLRLVAFVTDEAMHRYPQHVPLMGWRPVPHNCPCTCGADPYTCPVGRGLVSAILERKGNQDNVRTA